MSMCAGYTGIGRERERERERGVEREREGEKVARARAREARKGERERDMLCSACCHTDAVSRLRAGMCGCLTLVVGSGSCTSVRLSNGRLGRGARADSVLISDVILVISCLS